MTSFETVMFHSGQSYLKILRQSDAYMRQKTGPSLVQIMACRLAGAKSLSEPMLEYCSLMLGNKQWNLNWNSYIFIQEKGFENVVWKMSAILSRPQYAYYWGFLWHTSVFILWVTFENVGFKLLSNLYRAMSSKLQWNYLKIISLLTIGEWVSRVSFTNEFSSTYIDILSSL